MPDHIDRYRTTGRLLGMLRNLLDESDLPLLEKDVLKEAFERSEEHLWEHIFDVLDEADEADERV